MLKLTFVLIIYDFQQKSSHKTKLERLKLKINIIFAVNQQGDRKSLYLNTAFWLVQPNAAQTKTSSIYKSDCAKGQWTN